MPAVLVAAAKVRDSVPLLIGALPRRLGNSQRGLRWVRHRWPSSSSTGCGSGVSRSLLPLPTTRSTWLARSMALTCNVVASLVRRPHAYMTARQVLWTGLRIQPSSSRTWSSEGALGSRFWRGEASLFFPKQRPTLSKRVVVKEAKPVPARVGGGGGNGPRGGGEKV